MKLTKENLEREIDRILNTLGQAKVPDVDEFVADPFGESYNKACDFAIELVEGMKRSFAE